MVIALESYVFAVADVSGESNEHDYITVQATDLGEAQEKAEQMAKEEYPQWGKVSIECLESESFSADFRHHDLPEYEDEDEDGNPVVRKIKRQHSGVGFKNLKMVDRWGEETPEIHRIKIGGWTSNKYVKVKETHDPMLVCLKCGEMKGANYPWGCRDKHGVNGFAHYGFGRIKGFTEDGHIVWKGGCGGIDADTHSQSDIAWFKDLHECKEAESFSADGYKGISAPKIEILEWYIKKGGKAGDFHDLPTDVQIRLQAGNVHELLYQDVNRWLQDKGYNPHMETPDWLSAESFSAETWWTNCEKCGTSTNHNMMLTREDYYVFACPECNTPKQVAAGDEYLFDNSLSAAESFSADSLGNPDECSYCGLSEDELPFGEIVIAGYVGAAPIRECPMCKGKGGFYTPEEEERCNTCNEMRIDCECFNAETVGFAAETIKPMTIGLGLGIVALLLWGRNR